MMRARKITQDPAQAFRSVLIEARLQPGEIIADGEIRRCPTSEKPRSKNGWYVLNPDPPAGAFGDWATGISETWTLNGQSISPEEQPRLWAEIERQQIKREKQRSEQYRMKAKEAQRDLANLNPVGEANPYLRRKQVKPCNGLLVDGDDLIVPVLGPEDNLPMSFQRITSANGKKFMRGGKVNGGFFSVRGNDKDRTLCAAEGIATALSIHEATDLTVLVAFSAGNLESVAIMARGRYPDRQIIIAADNDQKTEKKTGENTGMKYATKAAMAVNGMVAVPGRPGDFNDLHQAEGLVAVKTAIEAARSPDTAENLAGQGDDWPVPISMIADERSEPYPVNALPGVIGEAVTEVTGFVQCPVSLTACSALATISTVAAGLVDVQRVNNLVGPAALYLLAVADSGERKSTVDRFFTRAIQDWEAEQRGLAEPKLQAYQATIEAWEAEKAGVVNAIREASKREKDIDRFKGALTDLEARKPEKPMVPGLLIGDATSEALTYRLALVYPVGGMLSAEAGVIFGGHAMNRESIMRNLATLNTF